MQHTKMSPRHHIQSLTRTTRAALPPGRHDAALRAWLYALANSEAPVEVRARPELLGWAFQQWRALDRRALVEAHRPVEASTLPLATQLFTDDRIALPLVEAAVRGLVAGVEGGDLREARILDPCCGAGHLLLDAFRQLLPAMTRAFDGERKAAAAHLLCHTLRGVELDPLCAEAASLTLKLEYARVTGEALEDAPTPQIGAFHPGDAPPSTRLALLQELGSALPADLLEDDDAVAQLLAAGADEKFEAHHAPAHAADVAPALTALEWLGERYARVVTNVPFLARAKQPPRLRALSDLRFPRGKADLSALFFERSVQFLVPGGELHLILPQNLLFLASYRALRTQLLAHTRIDYVHFLGEASFESDGAAGAFPIALGLTLAPADDAHQVRFIGASSLETGAGATAAEKQTWASQRLLQTQPGARIVPEVRDDAHPPLSDYAHAYVGTQTGDDPRYIRAFWEIDAPSDDWVPLLGTPHDFVREDGDSWLLHWMHAKGPLHQAPGARANQGRPAWGQRGIAIHRMRRIFAYTYAGQHFHQNIAVLVPKRAEDFDAIAAFCASPDFERAVRQIDKKLNVTNGTLTQIPFDLRGWRARGGGADTHAKPGDAREAPRPFLQRDFQSEGYAGAHAEQVAVARFLGYRWPAEREAASAGSSAAACSAHSSGPREACSAEARAAHSASASSSAEACSAHSAEATSRRVLFVHRAEERAALGEALRAHGVAMTDAALEAWLRDAFFEAHCRLFLARPFLWQLWDGEPDGFSAIVRYHALDRGLLTQLVEAELPAWRAGLRDARSEEAAARLEAAALRLEARLRRILVGEAPHDVFVRWRPLEDQARGWTLRQDDGVRVHLRPWLTDGDASGAGLLRARPAVHFRNDRGNDGSSSFWPQHGVEAGGRAGDRVNDAHLRLDEKPERG